MSEPTIVRVRCIAATENVPAYRIQQSNGVDPFSIGPAFVRTVLSSRGLVVPPDVDLNAMKPGDEFVPIRKPRPVPLDETWCCLWKNGQKSYAAPRPPALAAMVFGASGPPVAVLHVWSDADGDHADIERVQP